MNDYTSQFSNDFGAMSEQDMFAMSEVLAMIEPGAGEAGQAHWFDALIQAVPFYEISVLAFLAILGTYTLRQIITKTGFGQFLRLKFTS